MNPGPILALRSHSGISGDMLLAGLASLALLQQDISPESDSATSWLSSLCQRIMPDLTGCLSLIRHKVNGICGWQAAVNLPDEHAHRHPADILAIIASSDMDEGARKLAAACFELLAECEAEAHGIEISQVHFHEVGALDSILDICAVCELFTFLGSPQIIASPLPLADGQINCLHGILPAPAPAVLRLLKGIPVRPFPDQDAGELLTPTGLALLKSLGTKFGPWPEFRISRTSLVYGQREFRDTANGVIFALGQAWKPEASAFCNRDHS